MSGEKRVPLLHQAIATAAVKALLGERAAIREMVEVPSGPPLRVRAGALAYGVQASWRRLTGWQQKGSRSGEET